jgi:hypothetical protein
MAVSKIKGGAGAVALALAVSGAGCTAEAGKDGKDGTNGAACTVVEKDGLKSLSCPDGSSAVLTGIAGATGPAGANGTNGASALVTGTTTAPSDQCPGGGYEIRVGVDSGAGANAGNGRLDADEIVSTRLLCNGTNGTNGATGATGAIGPSGFNAAVRFVRLPADEIGPTTCLTGGQKIQVGLDANRNGQLDDAEVEASATQLVCDGAKGETGAKGDKGDTGETGAKGDKGDKGDAGDSVTVLKLNAGDVACPEGGVSIAVGSGLPEYACNGEAGLPGLRGVQGEVGPQGPAGPQGEPGPIGPAGAPGSIGPIGPQGPAGDTGPAGATGIVQTSPVGSVAFNRIYPGGEFKFIGGEQASLTVTAGQRITGTLLATVRSMASSNAEVSICHSSDGGTTVTPFVPFYRPTFELSSNQLTTLTAAATHRFATAGTYLIDFCAQFSQTTPIFETYISGYVQVTN